MNLILYVLITALDIYMWLIIASIIVSWLVVFDVLNTRNRLMARLCDLLNAVTRPGMEFFRRFLPPIGGIDLSPMAIIFAIYIVQGLLYSLMR